MAKRRRKGRTKGGAARKPAIQPSPPKPTPASDQPASDRRSTAGGNGGSPHLFYVLWALLAAGIGVAVYLLQHKIRISLDPEYVSSCNFGGAIDCDKVNTSEWSEMFGLPIALFAIPTYITWGFLAWRAKVGLSTGRDAQRNEGRSAIELASLIAAGAVIYSVFLAGVSTLSIGAYCLYCISLYVVNIAGAVLTFKIAPRGPADSLKRAVAGALDTAPPLGSMLAVLTASFLLAWGGYHQISSSMEQERLRQIDEQLNQTPDLVQAQPPTAVDSPAADAVNPVAETAAQTSPQTTASTSTQEVSTSAPPPAVPVSDASPQGRRGGTLTSSGWSYFEAPIQEGAEYWYGNPNATVTIVEYADFQCGFCRNQARQMKSIKKDYGDRVRFVMKHFPMNGSCNPQARGYDKHPIACEMAYAGHCAGEQGKFWEMHELMFDNQSSLTLESPATFANELGLDAARLQSCMQSADTRAKIAADVQSGIYAGFNGTPRMLINNHLLTGSSSTRVLEYYIAKALEQAELPQQTLVARPRTAGGTMVATEKQSGTFYIDPYEAVIDVDGRAISKPGVSPAQADYYTAKAACERAGKRLCTEEEWMSACSGTPAVDNNNNRSFAEDVVEGNLYPYGPFYVEGACNDAQDMRTGSPDNTGNWQQCATASGVFDMTGNIAEWVDTQSGDPLSMGGAMSTRAAECSRKSFRKPPASRNRSTGFRCCSDTAIESSVDVALLENEESVLYQPAPVVEAADVNGNPVTLEYDGQVTLVNFFASWCGPCKREFPYLVDYVDRYAGTDLQIVGIGLDTNVKNSIDFAERLGANFLVLTDPESQTGGQFLVYTMPATFLVDRQGVVRHQFFGFSGADQEAELRKAIDDLL